MFMKYAADEQNTIRLTLVCPPFPASTPGHLSGIVSMLIIKISENSDINATCLRVFCN